jgi:hypothetical protein
MVCRPGPPDQAGIILRLFTAQAEKTAEMQKSFF